MGRDGRTDRARFPIGGPFALTSDGRYAAMAQNNANPVEPKGSIILLDLRTGTHRSLQPLPVPGWTVSIELTSDDRTIVGRGFEGVTRAWDVASGAIVETFAGQGSGLNIALTPDDRTVFSESQDGTVAAWDLSGSQRLGRTFTWADASAGCASSPCFAIDPDGTLIAESGSKGRIRLFDLRAQRETALPARNGAVADAVGFTPDGALVTGGINGTVTFSDVRSRAVVRTFRFEDRVWRAEVSPDGELLAVQTMPAGGSTSRVEVRDIDSGETVYEHDVPNGIGGLEFSPDGRALAELGCCQPDSIIVVRAARLGEELFSPALDGNAVSIAFSPGGLLAAGSEDGKVVLWDVRSGEQLGPPIQVASGPIDPISFSPDGRRFAASSSDQTATLWDIQSRKRLGNTFPVEQSSIPVARFAAGGDLVIDNVAHVSVWPMDLRAWVRFACQVTGRDLTRAEWSDLLPDRPYRHVCPQ